MMEERIRPSSLSSRFHGLIITNLVFTDIKLGRGADATVYAVEWNGTVCAAKRLHEILLEDESLGGADKLISNFEEECLTWSKLRHPGVVQFLGVHLEGMSRLPVLVMEKMDTSLRRYLEDHSKEEFTLHLKVIVLRQVTQALAYLHGKNPPLVHHDLSTNNILLNVVSLVTKVSDFGMSRAISPSALTRKSSIKGTLAFMAPEALQKVPKYDTKLDVFSFSNVVISTLTHEWPDPEAPTKYEGGQLIALSELQRREYCTELFTAQEKQLFLPIVRQSLENRPDERPSSVMLVQELRRIESTFPTVSQVAASTEQLSQQLSAKEEECRQKDEAIREKDEAIREKDEAIREKDEAIREKDEAIREKDEAMREKDEAIREKDEAMREKDEAIREKDEAIREKDEALQEKDVVIWVKDEVVREKDEVIREKDKTLKEQDEKIRRKDDIILGKDKELQCRDMIVCEYNETLRKKDAANRVQQDTMQGQQVEIERLRNQLAATQQEEGIQKSQPGTFMKKLGFFRKKKTSVTESLAGEYLDPQIDLDNRPLPPIPSDSGGALKVEAKPVDEELWYYGEVSQKDAEQLLRKDGDYLIRLNREKGYILTMKWQGGPKHFLVQTTDDNPARYHLEGESFLSICELLEYYRESQIAVTRHTPSYIINPVNRAKQEGEKWSLRHDDIELGKQLGKGHFGEVWMGTMMKSRKPVVVDIYKSELFGDKHKFLKKAEILKQYDHPNIVKLIGIAAECEPFYVVMEPMPGGDFHSFLCKQGPTTPATQMLKFAVDAAEGMAYLASKNCIHRDLAARNCFVGENDTALKIAGFSMSRVEEGGMYEVSEVTEQVVPIKWTAPEALVDGKYSSQSDVWSYGILLWEMFSCGSIPYPGLSNDETIVQVYLGHHMDCPRGCPVEVQDLMKCCWLYELEDRPTFPEIVQELKRIKKKYK